MFLFRTLASAVGLASLPAVSALRVSLAGRDMPPGALRSPRLSLSARDVDPASLYTPYSISVPVDHFHNDSLYAPHTNATFLNRFWFDASYYKPGGPVIVLHSGETSGEDRLPFLQKGIVQKLASATDGIGVVLEHRYYGGSLPTANLSTASLRFLTHDQAVADMAYFARNVVFPGLEHTNLTSRSTPYIAYGGSYAGGMVAFARKLYPDVFWGAISSSGVTQAIYDYWQYFEAARRFAPPGCAQATAQLISVVDRILISLNGTDYPRRLMSAFGLANLTRSDDFAFMLSNGIGGLQYVVWDPKVTDDNFYAYCANVSAADVYWRSFRPSTVAEVKHLVEVGGFPNLTNQMLNLIGWNNDTAVRAWLATGQTADEYFGHLASYYGLDDIDQWPWRSWTYQYCTQWGYLGTGSGVPPTELPLVSRLVNLDFLSYVCKAAFGIHAPPDTDAVNKYGGYNISYPRLALVGGQRDPWRDATPLAVGLAPRKSTTSEPVVLIDGGVHHWDEWGVFPNETTAGGVVVRPPAPVADAQAEEVAFVKAWLAEWKAERRKKRAF